MKKKYRIQAERITDGKILDKECETENISHLVSLLGNYGFMVQTYHEVDENVIELSTHRR